AWKKDLRFTVNIATACNLRAVLLLLSSEVKGMKRYTDEDEKKKEEAYEEHKCKGCEWATWQQKQIVVCLFPRCVREREVASNVQTLGIDIRLERKTNRVQ
uniref:hypothetical protein n=1 Tax=Thermaerobacillus caldiproteolyticus TaxID=247480 RepID=UPI0018F1E52B